MERIPVEPSVLRWARESMRLTVEDAARRLGVSEETVAKWEGGAVSPTINQLRTAAEKYGRPLAVLLLSEPPRDFSVPRDFRDGAEEPSPRLIEEIRRAHEQRDVMLELSAIGATDSAGRAELPAISTGESPEKGGVAIRSFLRVNLATQRAWNRPAEALNGWIAAVEGQGVLVLQTSRLPLEDALGFSIHAVDFPVVALNGADWPRRKVFTLFHELAHLAIGSGGICDLHERVAANADTETFCNQVAAAALLPAEAFASVADRVAADAAWSLESLEPLADHFGVSQESALLRLVALGRATWDDYGRLKPELQARYRDAWEDQRRRLREAEGGPSYYMLHARNLGRRYTQAVLEAYHSEAISPLDVATYLRIRFEQLPKLEAAA